MSDATHGAKQRHARGRWARVTAASACMVVFVAASATGGCTLALTYPPDPTEEGPIACGDGIDNDGNGLTDCDDPSCGRCVAPPRVACPSGWDRRELDAPAGAFTCTPPTTLVGEGCPETAPPGAVVVAAGSGTLEAALRMLPQNPDPASPPVVVYLAPGAHVESGVVFFAHVALRGLCAHGTMPTLSPSAGHEAPFGSANGAVDIDHVEVVVAPMGSGPGHVAWSGAFTLTNARLRVATPSASMFDVGGTGLILDHSAVEVPLHFGTEGRIDATDAILGSVSGRVDLDLTRVAVRGDLTLGETGGGTERLVGSSVFVTCGQLALSQGAGAELRESVLTSGRYGHAVQAAGRAGFRASVLLEDVAIRFDASCPDTPPVRLGYTDTDVQMRRVSVSDSAGLYFGRHTRAELHDTAVTGPRIDVGLAIAGASCTADRLSVSDVRLVGVQVGSDGSVGADGEATLQHLYVDGVSPAADACGPPTAAGVLVGGLGTGGVGAAPPRVSIADARIDAVAGCALFVDPLATAEVARTELADSLVGLCAPSRSDVTPLTQALVLDHDGRDVDTDSARCAGRYCVPASCIEAGHCGNGIDDDGDGLTDCVDLEDCASDPACMHSSTETACHDGLDDDADGLVDCADPDCAAQCTTAEICTNGVDDDHDGLVDCADPDCTATCPPPQPEVCSNGIDDDRDGLVDCADPDCVLMCARHELCANGIDDDGDGLVDCADPDCPCYCPMPEACPTRDLGSALGTVAHGMLDTSTCSSFTATCAVGAVGAAITFAWTAPSTGRYTFDTLDSMHSGGTFDTVLSVRDGGCTGTELACNDDFAMTLSSVTTMLSAGQRVIVIVRAYGRVGTALYTLDISPG